MKRPSTGKGGLGTATRIGARNRKTILDAAIKTFIEKYLGLLTVLFFLLIVAGFVAVKYLL